MNTVVRARHPTALIQSYLESLKDQGRSPLTIASYQSDLRALVKRLGKRKVTLFSATHDDLAQDLRYLYNERLAEGSTLNRYLATTRGFYRYLVSQKILLQDPTKGLQSIRQYRIPPSTTLSRAEFYNILNAPDISTALGHRDRTIFQMLCETGMNISNIVELRIEQVDLAKKRIVSAPMKRKILKSLSLSPLAAAWIQEFVELHRANLLKEGSCLFPNHFGYHMTRQAVWYVIQTCARKAGVTRRVTSFDIQRAHVRYKDAENDL